MLLLDYYRVPQLGKWQITSDGFSFLGESFSFEYLLLIFPPVVPTKDVTSVLIYLYYFYISQLKNSCHFPYWWFKTSSSFKLPGAFWFAVNYCWFSFGFVGSTCFFFYYISALGSDPIKHKKFNDGFYRVLKSSPNFKLISTKNSSA